jgi:hypothetical protein
VAYEGTAELKNNREFTISVRFKKDAGQEAGGGRILYYAGTAVIAVGANNVSINGSTDAGESISLNATGLPIRDANWHTMTYTFSQSKGQASLYVDGMLVAQKSGLQGRQFVANGHAFHVGNPWGSNFPGLVDDVKFQGWEEAP